MSSDARTTTTGPSAECEQCIKSFADPDTHFEIVTTEVVVGRGGLTAERPTGLLRCEECGAVSHNIDDFPHDPNCSQRFVHSRWYVNQLV